MAGRPREFDDQFVIQAAMDAFWRNGFEATSAQELLRVQGLAVEVCMRLLVIKRISTMKPCAVIITQALSFTRPYSVRPVALRIGYAFCWKKVLNWISATSSETAAWQFSLPWKDQRKIKPLKI